MWYKKDEKSGDIRVTLVPGEPVLESLMQVFEKEDLKTISIGEGPSMVKGPIKLGKFSMRKRQYSQFVDFGQEYDVVSFNANIARHEVTGKPVMHLHMSFTDVSDEFSPGNRGLKKLFNTIVRKVLPESAFAVHGGHVMVVEKKEGKGNSGSRFENDFTAHPTAEFLIHIESDAFKRSIGSCPGDHNAAPAYLKPESLLKPPTAP